MMRRRWRRQRIEIRSTMGDLSVDAKVRGLFAVHPTMVGNGDRSYPGLNWTLTHLPSGWAINRAFTSEARAQEFCGRIEDLADWAMVTNENASQVIGREERRLIGQLLKSEREPAAADAGEGRA